MTTMEKINVYRKAIIAALTPVVTAITTLMVTEGYDSVLDIPERGWWVMLAGLLGSGVLVGAVPNGPSSNPNVSAPLKQR